MAFATYVAPTQSRIVAHWIKSVAAKAAPTKSGPSRVEG